MLYGLIDRIERDDRNDWLKLLLMAQLHLMVHGIDHRRKNKRPPEGGRWRTRRGIALFGDDLHLDVGSDVAMDLHRHDVLAE